MPKRLITDVVSIKARQFHGIGIFADGSLHYTKRSSNAVSHNLVAVLCLE